MITPFLHCLVTFDPSRATADVGHLEGGILTLPYLTHSEPARARTDDHVRLKTRHFSSHGKDAAYSVSLSVLEGPSIRRVH